MTKDLQRIRVAIADDHPIILLAVKDCLEQTLGYQVAIQETSGQGLLGALGSQPVSLIVTDFSMQHDDQHDGLRLITQLRRQYEHIPIVVFTMVTNPGVLAQLCRVGVAGLIGKDEEMAELGRVCQRVMTGGVRPCLSPSVEKRLAESGTTRNEIADFQMLSQKELEVVRMFCSGLSLTDIAKRQNRTLGTIATQKRSAMRKLNVDNNMDLVNCAREQGLI